MSIVDIEKEIVAPLQLQEFGDRCISTHRIDTVADEGHAWMGLTNFLKLGEVVVTDGPDVGLLGNDGLVVGERRMRKAIEDTDSEQSKETANV